MRKAKFFVLGFFVGLIVSAIAVGVFYFDIKEKCIFSKKARMFLGIEDIWLIKFSWPDFGREKIMQKLRTLEKTGADRKDFCESLGIKIPVNYEVSIKDFEQIPKNLKRKVESLKLEDKNAKTLLVSTDFLELWTIHLKPSFERRTKRFCIIHHGHGSTPFFEKADELIGALLQRGIEIYIPLQPYMDAAFSEYQVWSMGVAMGKQLMGLRLEAITALLDYIKKAHNNPEIIFVGRSGGSMVGIYTSICTNELDKLAIDYLTDVGQTTFKTLPHCELVYSFGRLGFSENEEFYKSLVAISQAKKIKNFEYGYLKIGRLLEFIEE